MDEDDNMLDRSEDEREDEVMTGQDSVSVVDENDNDGDGDNEIDVDEDEDDDEEDREDDGDGEADGDDDVDGDGEQDGEGNADGYEPTQAGSQQPAADRVNDMSTVGDNEPLWLYSYSHSRQFAKDKLIGGLDTCVSYDIAPYVAAPMSTSINCMDLPQSMRWLFTGGQDGFIRKFDFYQSVNGKLPLTVAQKHPFADTITKAGVLVSYWENEAPLEPDLIAATGRSEEHDMKVSPVYALAVQSQCLWLVSGLETGGITLQTIRHAEGHIHAHLQKHTSAVSVLRLNCDETSVISGSWDKNIVEWDLNRGDIMREFTGSTGQISVIAWRPDSVSAVPLAYTPVKAESNSAPANYASKESNELSETKAKDEDSDLGSLFGEDEDDDDQDKMALDPHVGDDAMEVPVEAGSNVDEVDETNFTSDGTTSNGVKVNEGQNRISSAQMESAVCPPSTGPTVLATGNHQMDDGRQSQSNNIFLTASIDGKTRIWDRRMARCISEIGLSANVPPWCMSACWSLDGNNMYIGRRNGIVEEYSVHAFDKPVRSLKLPGGSGPVSCVTPMPNGRHLVCASFDNVRLYDLKASAGTGSMASLKNTVTSKVPFLIVPGHHGGTISDILIDQSCQYMVTTGGNRGWEGSPTEVMLVYEIEKIV
ncbi:WD40-repeat-containing domain protein [Lipomyces kononenkoae]|uniref:WD40-repeat-containing domain protein n=1 Tax=Lipomyces kononenkoae TaxID=34357 RepID=A0ACC3T0X0_LIPKO